MDKKVSLKIEQYDNGITLSWEDLYGNEDKVKRVCLEHNKTAAIGEIVWSDILQVLNASACNAVELTITINSKEVKE